MADKVAKGVRLETHLFKIIMQHYFVEKSIKAWNSLEKLVLEMLDQIFST